MFSVSLKMLFCYVLLARLKESVRFPFLAAGVDVVRCVLPRSCVPIPAHLL